MNPGLKMFQEYLTNQGTVVKPYRWQTQSQICAKCPYHIRTGEEARVPYAEFLRAFGFPYRTTAQTQTHHLLFYELRSFSGTVVQKGHATSCDVQDSHPESMLFEADGYLDAVIHTYGNIGCITLYSNYSPCNEAYQCCVSKIYRFLLKHPETMLCLYFSQPYHIEDSFPTAMWNRQALHSLASLWPLVTLQPLPTGTRCHLLSNFVHSIPESICPAETLSDGQNPHQINNLRGVKTYCREATHREPAVQQNLKAFSSPHPAFQQPLRATKGSLLHPMSQSHSVLFPGSFLPSQREHLHLRPINVVRHLKMPKGLIHASRNPESSRNRQQR
ncbi:putative C-_U-editing enzyme APOBEC-4 [Coturnix japonica]|uniref:putative C->U-editing enzyme APOBEC-4 n=1 Tax=Coturnix japonica TaxID=93934 RepID=UPI000777944A|nr:putative C->U-editing enzyme APOBEC-4 [Coturnix japonica]XP_015725078.1 putative C->U-editing enzyme APOBEC-4 [Coturnix japonica]